MAGSAATSAEDRTARLQAVAASLSEVLSVAEVSRVGLEQMVGALGAAAGAVCLVDREGQALESVQMVGYSAEQRARFGRLPLAAAMLPCDAVRTGEALWLSSPEEISLRYPDTAHYRRGGIEAVAAVPLMVDGWALGSFVLSFGQSRRLAAEDREFCLAIARQCAQALDRARVLEELRATAADNARLYREAREAVRLRDEFLSIASHELRTPLTPLSLQLKSLQRALQRLPEPDGGLGRLSGKVAVAMRQTERLSTLVSSLLDVTRITSGRLSLRPEEMDLAALTRDVVERFADQLESAGCAFTVRAGTPVPGRWDRLRLEQVITNLLTNALKYGGGRPIELEVTEAEGRAVFRISDQGIGIAAEDQERIFERFERAVSSDAYGGLGLGLYITRRIVEAHGGTVQVESEPGVGATFTVWLPPQVPGTLPPTET